MKKKIAVSTKHGGLIYYVGKTASVSLMNKQTTCNNVQLIALCCYWGNNYNAEWFVKINYNELKCCTKWTKIILTNKLLQLITDITWCHRKPLSYDIASNPTDNKWSCKKNSRDV